MLLCWFTWLSDGSSASHNHHYLVMHPWQGIEWSFAFAAKLLWQNYFFKELNCWSEDDVTCAVFLVKPCRLLAAVEHTSRLRACRSWLLAQFNSVSCTEGSRAHRWISQRPGMMLVELLLLWDVDDVGGVQYIDVKPQLLSYCVQQGCSCQKTFQMWRNLKG